MLDASDRFALHYDAESYRRVIAGEEVILHCHHYNARIQRTLEGAPGVDGKATIRDAADYVFHRQLTNALHDDDSPEDRLRVAEQLFAHLGFGSIDLSKVAVGEVTASSSHFVEGWHAGFKGDADCVCTFAEGFLQGVIRAATGQTVEVREVECMHGGFEVCRFLVEPSSAPAPEYPRFEFSFSPDPERDFVRSETVDEKVIIDALVATPFVGDDDGLIPAFGVYLANMPADFYNIACHSFVHQMTELGKLSTARELLISDGESCALNTFRGILESPEWDALVQPMVHKREDKLFGLVSISNALGWGNWHVGEHTPGETLELVSLNGYEALGYRSLFSEPSGSPMCFMLAGVSAGLMELVYSYGKLEDRYGTFLGDEDDCICTGTHRCSFRVEAA